MIKSQKYIKKLSDSCPENFLHEYLLISAEIERLNGHDLIAMDYFHKAIQSAKENNYIQNEAIANELTSNFFRTKNYNIIANTYLKEARDCYQKWGAFALADRLMEWA